METIFDHNPTAEELRYLAGPGSADEYRARVTNDEALTGLAVLFAMRGDEDRASEYADQISDRDFVRFTLQNGDLMSSTKRLNAASSSMSASKAA